MPDPVAPEDDDEPSVVLSSKMIESVNVPIRPVLVRFAVPEDWFSDTVRDMPPPAPDVPPPVRSVSPGRPIFTAKLAKLKR